MAPIADAVTMVMKQRWHFHGLNRLDRPTGERGDWRMGFFGPFVLALAAGSPVLPSFCTMKADGRAPIWVKSGRRWRSSRP